MSLSEEFTEPFDLERYKNGEQALYISPSGGHLREFSHQIGDKIFSVDIGGTPIDYVERTYKMLPFDGWIEVKGKAPFSAKAGEWEYETVGGCINLAGYPTDHNPEYIWLDIKRARRIMKKVEPVSNGWIYCNGKTMPEEIKVLGMDDRIEFVTGQGKVESGKKKSVITWFMHTMFAHENIVAVRALKKESIQDIDSSRKSVMERPELMKRQILEETAQQARTREAYTNYKAKHAPLAPYIGLREGEIEEIAGAAIAQMKPWWGK